MAKTYNDELLSAVHETAAGLRESDVMTKRKLKVFDEMCIIRPKTAAQRPGRVVDTKGPKGPAVRRPKI
jgi:hypothetical protein